MLHDIYDIIRYGMYATVLHCLILYDSKVHFVRLSIVQRYSIVFPYYSFAK